MRPVSRFVCTLLTLTMSLALGISFVAGAATASPSVQAKGANLMPEISIPNCVQPPANKDLTALTNAELAVYGLPSKPTDSKRLALWRLNLQHAKHRICQFQRRSRIHEQATMISGPFTLAGVYNNSLWAGNLAIGSGYTAAESSWNLPCLITSQSPSNSWSSAWVGLGGYPGNQAGQLIQSGTDSQMINGSPHYDMWAEDYGPNLDSGNLVPNFTPRCGDQVYADEEDYGSSANMTIDDWSQNQYFSYGENGSQWTNKASISADWVIESAVGRGVPLADFNTVTFTGAWTYHNSTGAYVGQTYHEAANMCSDSINGFCGLGSITYAVPGAISSDNQNFPVYWKHS